jgi:hypothetical protein
MTQEHIEQIEEIRPLKIKKKNIRLLRDIYNEYTGIYVRDCFCNAEARENFYNLFYDWYDNFNSNHNNDSNSHNDNQIAG